jgi:hypothetical protein
MQNGKPLWDLLFENNKTQVCHGVSEISMETFAQNITGEGD